MNATDINRTNTTGATLAGVLSASIHAFTTWNKARATRKSLAALSTSQLNDIGFSRGDLESFSR